MAHDMDKLRWVAYFEVGNLDRSGYDYPAGTVLRCEMDVDARKLSDPLHPMAQIITAMRTIWGVSVLTDFRASPEEARRLMVQYEMHLTNHGKKAEPMPKGFAPRW